MKWCSHKTYIRPCVVLFQRCCCCCCFIFMSSLYVDWPTDSSRHLCVCVCVPVCVRVSELLGLRAAVHSAGTLRVCDCMRMLVFESLNCVDCTQTNHFHHICIAQHAAGTHVFVTHTMHRWYKRNNVYYLFFLVSRSSVHSHAVFSWFSISVFITIWNSFILNMHIVWNDMLWWVLRLPSHVDYKVKMSR